MAGRISKAESVDRIIETVQNLSEKTWKASKAKVQKALGWGDDWFGRVVSYGAEHGWLKADGNSILVVSD